MTPFISHPSWSDFHSPYKVTSRITSSMFPVPSTSSLMWQDLFSDPMVPHESFRPSISKSTHWWPFLFPFESISSCVGRHHIFFNTELPTNRSWHFIDSQILVKWISEWTERGKYTSTILSGGLQNDSISANRVDSLLRGALPKEASPNYSGSGWHWPALFCIFITNWKSAILKQIRVNWKEEVHARHTG